MRRMRRRRRNTRGKEDEDEEKEEAPKVLETLVVEEATRTLQKAKLDLQKSIVTNSSTYLIICNVYINTVVPLIFSFFLS